MKKHLKALLAGAAVAGSILACTAAYARFSDSVTVTNHISVGDINISLQELEKKDGREMKYQDRRIVLPGDEISKIPRITNRSEPCWVRVKISYTDDLEGLDGLDDRNLTGMSPRWIRKGEYFYYTRKLEQGDSVDIFTGVTVPSQWDALFYDISDLRILFRKIIQGIEGEMHRLFIFFYHPGKNFQLTVCSKLNITTENLPAI